MVAVAGGIGITAAACSTIQPSLGEYAITTAHGSLSNQQVTAVVAPGQELNLGSGTTTWYFPGDVRNFVTGKNGNQAGDRAQSAQVLTGANGNGPGLPVYVYSYMGFEVNPAITSPAHNYKLATAFLSFCLKYACASQNSQNDTGNASLAHSSTSGWENMLSEVMPTAIDNATRMEITRYGPELWTTQTEWNTLATDIGAQLESQVNILTGSTVAGTAPYFCGPGSTVTKCTPFVFEITKVTPASAAVSQAYNSANAAQYQLAAARARLAAAKAAYGPYANWVLAMEDVENNCPSKCSIVVGNSGGVAAPAP